MPRKVLRFAAVAAIGAAVSMSAAACSPSTFPTGNGLALPPPGHVLASHYVFAPRDLTIHAGDTVTWEFIDNETPHDVFIPSLGARSPILIKGTWSYRFTTPGVYNYICTLHSQMTGTVTVH